MSVNPGTVDELEQEGAIVTSRSAIVDIFDACLIAQFGVTEASCEPPVATKTGLTIEQQSKPFEMGEVAALIGVLQFIAGCEHSLETEGAELVECGMGEHDAIS
jgi:hypothetical protein